MVKEKTFFDFFIGKFHFVLKNEYEYTDKNGKEHFNKLFQISSWSNEDDKVVRWLSLYSGWNNPSCVYETCGYYTNHHCMHISLGYGILFLIFPWRNKKVHEEDVNNPEKKYGFYLYKNGGLFDSFWYYVNKNGKSSAKCIMMPWALEFYRHSILLRDGSWWTMLEKDRRKAVKAGIDTYQDRRYYLDNDDEEIHKISRPFRYVTKGGEVQETKATAFMEEREWRPRWMQWTKLLNHVETCLDIQFADQMGNQRGTWKGGVLGCGCEVTREERDNLDLVSPLERFEKEASRTHRFCR